MMSIEDVPPAHKAFLQAEIAILQVESAFVSDPDRRNIEYWYEKKLSRYYSLYDVLQYAKVHRWNEKRVAFWKGVQSAWLKQKQLTLMQELSTELNETKDIRDHVLRLIKPKRTPDGVEVFTVQPKSLEGMIRAYAALDDVVERKRKDIMEMIEPMLGQSERKSETEKQHFSGSEMREIAHQLLSQRRKQRRVELGIEDDDNANNRAKEDKKTEDSK